MLITSVDRPVKTIKRMYEVTKEMTMDSEIQREAGQWMGRGNEMKRSLLINSMLNGYPIPPIYFKKTQTSTTLQLSCLDGKQRLSTVFDFINGEYPLHPDTPAVKRDGDSYELANKYFRDLSQECQAEILSYRFKMYGFECREDEDEDDLISEVFFRLNSGVALSGGQKLLSLVDIDTTRFIRSILKGRFFSKNCKFSALQRRRSDDLLTLVQAMLLLDCRNGLYDLNTISENDVMAYARSIKRNYSEGQRKLFSDVINYLDAAFPEPDKNLKKINIPILAVAAVTAMGKSYNPAKNIYRVGPAYFKKWFSDFFTECYDEYGKYCSSGSIKKEKTIKRIEIMENSLISFFELDKDNTEQTANISPDETATDKENTAKQENDSSLAEALSSGEEETATAQEVCESSPEEADLSKTQDDAGKRQKKSVRKKEETD